MWILNFIPEFFINLILAAGVVATMAGFTLSMIPFVKQYQIVFQIVGILLLGFGLYMEGGLAFKKEMDLKVAELKVKLKEAEANSGKVNTVIQDRVVNKVKTIKEVEYVNRDIIKEVVGKQADANCVLPKSAVWLHDSTVNMQVSRGTESVDGTPSTIKTSQFIDRVIENYSGCQQNTEKLEEWQKWYTDQKKTYESVNK